MSVYRFKSRETGDLVMLAPHAQRILEIIGKDPGREGIVLPQQMPAAIQALKDAVALEEAEHKRQAQEPQAEDDPDAPAADQVSLRMRSAPFIEMMQRCEQAGVEIVWGA
jgi:Fe-S cluster assembly ATPase SufC